MNSVSTGISGKHTSFTAAWFANNVSISMVILRSCSRPSLDAFHSSMSPSLSSTNPGTVGFNGCTTFKMRITTSNPLSAVRQSKRAIATPVGVCERHQMTLSRLTYRCTRTEVRTQSCLFPSSSQYRLSILRRSFECMASHR